MLAPHDVEGVLVAYLEPLLGVPVSTRIPNPRPAAHVRVSRAGGNRLNLVTERPLLIVECWAGTSPAAFDLAARAWSALDGLEDADLDGAVISSVDLASPVNVPDPDTTSPRYQFTAQPVVRLKETA